MSITANIGVNMKRRRKELGLSLQEVADRASTSKSHIWELEQGRSANPTITMTLAVADALSMSINRLIGRDISQPLLSDEELELIQQHRRIFGKKAGHHCAETAQPRQTINDRMTILRRLADGDTIVYSQDGDQGWFTKGDRAFVGDEIILMRARGFIKSEIDPTDETDNYRGMAEYDTISDLGRLYLKDKSHDQL